ncbi:MAG: hypothetical protein WB709_12845 [Solirubrobacteraceae bacterium]
MRASLLHPIKLSDRRRARRARGRHRPAPPHRSDIAAQRVRQAGGPTDLASYTCACGYLFVASVTTTVECPHCGASQAW